MLDSKYMKDNAEVVWVWRTIILLYDDPELLSLTEFWEYGNLPRDTSLSFESSPPMRVGKVEVGSAHRNCKFLKKRNHVSHDCRHVADEQRFSGRNMKGIVWMQELDNATLE